MPSYVTPTEAEAYCRSTITADIGEHEAAVEVASNAIDFYTQRSFIVPTAATTRAFVVLDGYLAKVDDIADTTGLVIIDNGVTIAAAGYQLETSPGRTARPDPAGVMRPFAYVRHLSSSWYHDDEATLVITARYGWPAVPDAVKLATKMLAKDLLSARDTRFGLAQVGDFSRRIATNGMVAALLDPLKSADSIGIA